MSTYRDVKNMQASEVLHALRLYNATDQASAIKQIEIFTLLGGDPDDHNYAYLSYLTRELREEGYKIGSSRRYGLWLES